VTGQVGERPEKQGKAAGASRPSSPRPKEEKMSRDSVVDLCLSRHWVEG
jgi:hypothetical protein